MPDVSLPYGVASDGRYIHISQVTSGATDLRCPYCEERLTAKKGKVLTHHFAHTGETCLASSERDFESLSVPGYDRFDLHIKPHAWEILYNAHEKGEWPYNAESILSGHDPPLLKEDLYDPRNRYKYTNEGKLPFGEVTLEWFAEFQLKEVQRRHFDLSRTVKNAYYGVKNNRDRYIHEPASEMVPINIADLNIYRSQVGRLYGLHLYLLKITCEDRVLHKIGVSSRDVESRIVEIERDLIPLIGVKAIEVDRLCKNRGAIERYTQHRYRDYHYPLGALTEYFQFDKKTLTKIRGEFTRLGDLDYERESDYWLIFDGAYVPDHLIGEILSGQPSHIERTIIEEEYTKRHTEATKAGMLKAKERGVHIGRPADSVTEILEKYPEVVEALKKSHAIKQIAREHGVSRNTARKVRDAMN